MGGLTATWLLRPSGVDKPATLEDTKMNSQVLYEERSGWSWWVHPLIGLTFLAAVFSLVELARGNVGGWEGAMPVWEAALLLLLGFGLPGSIYALMGQLRTRITSEGIEIRWGFLEVIRKNILFAEVEGVEAITYSPLGEFGGWGIRIGGNKKKAWTVRGNRAVLLRLKDGTHFYLGSDRPERVLQWVLSAMKRSKE